MKISESSVNIEYSRNYQKKEDVKRSSSLLVNSNQVMSGNTNYMDLIEGVYSAKTGFDVSSNVYINQIDEDPETQIEKQSFLESISTNLIGQDVSITQMQSSTIANNGFSFSPFSQSTIEVQVQESHTLYEKEQVNIVSSGTIKTEEGKEINFNLQLGLAREFESVENHISKTAARLVDPIVINFNGYPPELSDTYFSFDLNADGTNENVNALKSGNGFLALDQNEDGTINDGTELFGAITGNGFAELSDYDIDQNMWIDENDPVFEKLSIWTVDSSGNDKMVSLKDAGIGAIYLDAATTQFSFTGEQNDLKGKLKQTGIYVQEDGNVHNIYQIDLAVQDQNLNLESDNQTSIISEISGNDAQDEGMVNISLPNWSDFIGGNIFNVTKKTNVNSLFIGLKSSKDDEPSYIELMMEKLKERIEQLREDIREAQEESRKNADSVLNFLNQL